jgi:hypothetical protein
MDLEELLAHVAPTAAVMLNIQISLVHSSIMEEGATLARTLLPYLNQITDYRFLTAENNFITSRFLASLITHICDTQEPIEEGFILFALQLNPRTLKDIFDNQRNIGALRGALRHKKFPESATAIMCIYPQKFLWPDLMSFWQGKSDDMIR